MGKKEELHQILKSNTMVGYHREHDKFIRGRTEYLKMNNYTNEEHLSHLNDHR